MKHVQVQGTSCEFARPRCVFLFVSIIVSLLPGCLSTTCAVGYAADSAFQVQVANSLCGGESASIGTYVDTEDLFMLSKVYVKRGTETRFLYKIAIGIPSQPT